MKKTIALLVLAVLLLFNYCKKDDLSPENMIPKSGLISYYPFNNNADDESGNSYHGILSGTQVVSGRVSGNSVARFDGEDDFISMGDVFDDVISGYRKQFSITLWMKLDNSVQKRMVLIAKNADSNCTVDERQFDIQVDDAGRIHFIWLTDPQGNGIRGVLSTTAITDSQWNHLAFSYDGYKDTNDGLDRVKIYINGVEESTTLTYNKNPLYEIPEGQAHYAFGNFVNSSGENCGSGNFCGEMDEITLHNRILTSDEVHTIYKN